MAFFQDGKEDDLLVYTYRSMSYRDVNEEIYIALCLIVCVIVLVVFCTFGA